MPRGLSEPVIAYMTDVVGYLEANGKYSRIDDASLHMLARQLDVFYCAAAAVNVEGLMVYDDKQKLIANPKIFIMNQAETMCVKVMKEYGLMAKARKELGGMAASMKKSPLEQFMDK
ncbi:phage terminase, small subunit, putative, P27 family [Prevotella sp. KH2C16]|nr:phage terminase, small subunit, putative, P27 family [Prevotella sp. KH2C16]